MKILKQGQEARHALKRGIDLVANCVRTTLGPSGRNAVLGRQDITPIITNDGVTIARHIEAEDPIENQGVWIVKEAAMVADLNGGDGTTTATVILQKIIHELFEQLKDDGSLVKKKIDTIKLKKEVDRWCEIVVDKLKAASRPITDDDILKVAKVSAEYDWLATIVADIWKRIGKDGYVTIEEASKTSYQIFNGVELDAGYSSEYFITNDKRECVIDNPYILITNQRIDTNAIIPISELLGPLGSKGATGLIIVAPEFSRDALSRFETTKVKSGFSILAIKVPTFDKDDILVDLSILTEGKFLDKKLYARHEDFFKEFVIENCGRAERAIIGDNRTRILGGSGDTSGRIEDLKRVHQDLQSAFDKDALEKRIAGLSGGMAVIKIGGESEFEKGYYKLKCEDAVNAVQNALKEGVVKGGGLALKEIAETLPPNILTEALKAPYLQIQENSGGIEISDDIIDPVKTTVSSLRSACSVAGTVITTEVVVAYKPEDSPATNHD